MVDTMRCRHNNNILYSSPSLDRLQRRKSPTDRSAARVAPTRRQADRLTAAAAAAVVYNIIRILQTYNPRVVDVLV